MNFLDLVRDFTHLNAREPVGLLIYYGILFVLVYRYYREGADVFREYGRLHREILKEPSLIPLYTDEWKQRLGAATHLFNLGTWLICAISLLLFQFVGLMILLSPGQSDDNTRISRSSASLSTTVVVTAATQDANATAVVVPEVSGAGHNASTVPTQLEPRAEAQRLLGFWFIILCGFVALEINRTKYTALRMMHEFSNQSK
ncbi:MAG: hypothetical protein MN733_43320 [Nitrososphaera sp.]|nr:hypothetical protein [Nitrososphaera sp.]